MRCFAECVGLYPVLLSDQKEGTLQTAVTETQPEEKAKRSSMCLYFIHHIDYEDMATNPGGLALYLLGSSASKDSQRESSGYHVGSRKKKTSQEIFDNQH